MHFAQFSLEIFRKVFPPRKKAWLRPWYEGTMLEKRGIFDWDIFLIIMKGLPPFRHFTIIKNISQLNVRHAFQASYPKLDARLF